MGRLYVVSTPIGNLGDVTIRAADTLRAVDRIVAEDTRRARTLLGHLGVGTHPESLHKHNEASRCAQVVGWLDGGADVALISDAGTPLLSDPGERVVRAAVDGGHDVVPLPGPSAILAGLVASGLPCDRFTFHGFLPRTSGKRDAAIERIREAPETSVVFEAPGRLVKTLALFEGRLGPARRIAVCRELTKRHEEVRRGTAGELIRYYGEVPPRGEITLVVEGKLRGVHDGEGIDLVARAEAALEDGQPPTAIARQLARDTGVSRSAAYEAVLAAKGRTLSS